MIAFQNVEHVRNEFKTFLAKSVHLLVPRQHSSVRLLSWSVLLGHFSSDVYQISYINCFHQTLVQVRIWVLCDER